MLVSFLVDDKNEQRFKAKNKTTLPFRFTYLSLAILLGVMLVVIVGQTWHVLKHNCSTISDVVGAKRILIC